MNVCMISLGCSKNLVDSERMMARLSSGGYQLTTDLLDADIAVINTCGFIQSAKEEAIDTILQMAELKEEGSLKYIIVTGCLAERYQEEVAEQFPEADAVIGIGNQGDIVDVLNKMTQNQRVTAFAPKCQMPLTGKRVIATPPHIAYLKIAEGCSNGCSYCAIPAIRGKYVSVPMEDVLAEAEELAAQGVKEIIVIAQDTTRYGEDLYGKSRLPELLTALSRIEEFRWIRVLYCYPERITDELITVIANEPKIVKYLDIPIQHCNAEILSRMRRKGCNREMLRDLFSTLRSRIPGMTIRTTLLVGFPGETQAQFDELSEFVNEMKFDRMGCFAYSEEENTPAAKMEPQLDLEVRQHRADVLMEQQMQISAALTAARVGTVTEAVVEHFSEEHNTWMGRTAADAPEVDGCILISADKNTELHAGQFVTVRITDTLNDYDLIGEVVQE
ncbi:MAG: 30S ribosomal protein S12 methylthiotransferase RimO [Oscillospiraceae bacterium]|nr:30S ribosomal protein S12 methylthiotransferase RimO [Oscillospiraceae bacterium]